MSPRKSYCTLGLPYFSRYSIALRDYIQISLPKDFIRRGNLEKWMMVYLKYSSPFELRAFEFLLQVFHDPHIVLSNLT